LPGNSNQSDIGAFVACDRGSLRRDVMVLTTLERNRALHGDVVYCELRGAVVDIGNGVVDADVEGTNHKMKKEKKKKGTADEHNDDAGDDIVWNADQATHDDNTAEQQQQTPPTTTTTWQEDDVQMKLWNPQVTIPKKQPRPPSASSSSSTKSASQAQEPQYQGRVIAIEPPQSHVASEIQSGLDGLSLQTDDDDNDDTKNNKDDSKSRRTAPQPEAPNKTIVGSLKVLPSGTVLLTPLNKCLPQFRCPNEFAKRVEQELQTSPNNDDGKKNKNNHKSSGDKKQPNTEPTNNDNKDDPKDSLERDYYQALYTYGAWGETHKWPPCHSIQKMGKSCLVEDEIRALLLENDLDHGEHPPEVLQDVDRAVKDGLYSDDNNNNNGTSSSSSPSLGWKPTEQMYQGRRDYRSQRIFTIDPTTAKDLDDALHISQLTDNIVEVGVHIADVSYFVQPNTPVDKEAQRRATTVYLVDRTIPMLPRPLCEVACSLNENVERLAFSCVWQMHMDGTLVKKAPIWYGRTVIRCCARLDYATAQNIIDEKVLGNNNDESHIDEVHWPSSRRPTGGHTLTQVANDVRLLHKVAMERRKMRFDNGALALNGIKLTFKLDPKDGQTPLLAAPYPIRDSNRLVEEYMLLANYLVAQRLITSRVTRDRAVLRNHPEPLEDGLDKVAAVAKAAIGFDIDISSSQALHDSLHRLRQVCDEEHSTDPLILQAVTQMLMTPMQPADYFVTGNVSPPEMWKHFALNIPYYTHFTSPIRRYPDVLVHRLLQETLDAEGNVMVLPQRAPRSKQKPSKTELDALCTHCNEKRMASKTAQERCDRVFLSLYVRAHPLRGEMGLVLSVGVTSFTVFVPSLGASTLLYLEEHKDILTYKSSTIIEDIEDDDDNGAVGRSIMREQHGEEQPKTITLTNLDPSASSSSWSILEIDIFVKISVMVYCRDKPPIDIKLRLEGPWAA